jgi:gluconate kinase
MITCPNCGELNKADVQIYNESLRRQSFNILPILPVCKRCGSEVTVLNKCSVGNIISLNGTCGSGKSTIAEALSARGFLAIDGDCAIQTVRHKTGKKQYEWNELIDEIAYEIDVLSMYSKNIVLSHIILPDDLVKYTDIFESRNMKYSFFLLKPEYQAAVERCQSRTCHANATPEYWIKHFYELLNFDDGVTVVDNTNMTVGETVEYILRKAGLYETI